MPEKTRSRFASATSLEALRCSVADTAGRIALRSVLYSRLVDVEESIRSRRTIKAFEPEPVDRTTLDELLELARWAPNHNLTNPWRFRVLGPASLGQLKEAAAAIAVEGAPAGADLEKVGETAAAKLDRAPTLVVCSVVQSGEPVQDEEDRYAAACAAYVVLLGAHGRGLAGYWRTPAVLRSDAGRRAVGLGENEHFIGLLHLGRARQATEPPGRDGPESYVDYLD
jgi:nitroreductase